MKKVAVQVGDDLSRLQVGFKRELISEVKVFVVDAQEFRDDFERNGPTVRASTPEAVDRLTKYTQMFEVRRRKWKNYCSGGALRLPVTRYELEKTGPGSPISRSCTTCGAVLSTISGYADVLWVDIVQQLEEMKEQVGVFSVGARSCPGRSRSGPHSARAGKPSITSTRSCHPRGLELAGHGQQQDLSGMTDSNLDPIGGEETFKLEHPGRDV